MEEISAFVDEWTRRKEGAHLGRTFFIRKAWNECTVSCQPALHVCKRSKGNGCEASKQ